jgi:hypothetical protein
MPDQPGDLRGPRIFGYLTEDEARWLPVAERDRLARAVRKALPPG